METQLSSRRTWNAPAGDLGAGNQLRLELELEGRRLVLPRHATLAVLSCLPSSGAAVPRARLYNT